MIVHVPGYMMTGDFLFNGEGGVGRDDLPSGRVHVHWDALSVLDRFEGHTIVCSGHDPPGTTMMSLDWNRANNPILSMTSFKHSVHGKKQRRPSWVGFQNQDRYPSEPLRRIARDHPVARKNSFLQWVLRRFGVFGNGGEVLQFFKRHLLVVG